MTPANSTIPDSNHRNFVHKITPKKFMPYVQLMRLDRPIGIWLLLFPSWWGIALGTSQNFLLTTLINLFLFAIGSVVIRSAGCIYNDILDRDLDAQVERTKNRPLASKALSLKQAYTTLFLLLGIGFLILLMLNKATILMGILSLFLIGTYPLMKRITHWPQAFLGLTMNWGILMGATAAKGMITFSSLLLYGAAFFWTLGYDTIYAHQDKEDDMFVGIKSTAIALGEHTKLWVTLFYAASLLLLSLVPIFEPMPLAFFVTPLAVAILFLGQILTLDIHSPRNCLKVFKSNKWVGIIIFCGIFLTKLFYH